MWEKFVNLFDSFGKIAAAVAAVLGLYAAYVQLNSSVAPPPRNEASVPASAPASPSVPVLATLPSEPRSEPQETRKVDRPVAAAEQKHPQPTSPSYQWSYPAGTAETNVIVTTMPASDEKQGGSNETEADEATGPKLSKPGNGSQASVLIRRLKINSQRLLLFATATMFCAFLMERSWRIYTFLEVGFISGCPAAALV